MAIPATINDDILRGAGTRKTHRSFNNSLLIEYQGSDEGIRMPANSIISKYKEYFDPYIDTVELNEEEQRKYRYSPKKFCQDMYGTIEYWSLILFINECHSIIDFEPVKLKYIVPESIADLINEILILEGTV